MGSSILRLLATLALFHLTTLASHAGVQMTLITGAGGVVRPDSITPVLVILQNDDTDRNGSVAVDLLNADATIGAATRKIPLPPLSRKSVFLYLPASSTPPAQVRVRYLDASLSAVSETTEAVRTASVDVPLFAFVGNVPPGFPPAEDDKGTVVSNRVFLTPNQVPDRWEGLQPFDAVVFTAALPHPLESAQHNALMDWVLRGGVLVIAADAKTDGLMALASASLIPLSPRTLEVNTLDVFGSAVEVMTGTMERASILLESNSLPLVAQRNLGLGSIVCTMVSFDDPAVRRWEGWAGLWQRVLANPVPAPENTELLDSPPSEPLDWRNALISAVQPERRPAGRVALVALLAALYAVAVGPMDHTLVKYLKRPYMTWITFPAIVAVFTACSWLGAKHLVGGDMSARFVQRTLYSPGSNAAATCRIIGLFAPATGTYALSDDARGLLQPLESLAPYSTLHKASTFDNTASATIDRIPIWNHRAYVSSVASRAPCPVDLRVSRENGSVSVSVANTGSGPLGNGWLCYGHKVWSVPGTLAPGSDTSVLLDPNLAREFPAALPGESFAFRGCMGHLDAPRLPALREMDVRPALARGALLFVATVYSPSTSTLNVNGEMLTVSCVDRLEIVVYPDQDTL